MLINYLFNQLDLTKNSGPYWVAYSGGLDSHVLLHAMAQLRQQNPGLKVQAIHVHHGLSEHAEEWLQHCQNICAQLNIPLYCHYLKNKPDKGESVEAWARTERYQIFSQHLVEGDMLLTAHTQDDQAETVLLQLLRGAGPKGLAAMPVSQAFASGFLIRPLLNLTRAQLQEYAQQNHLIWIEDESNEHLRFNRNFLRHQVIPLLRQRWPQFSKSIARSAHNCAEAANALAELAEIDLKEHQAKPALPIKILQDLPQHRQRNAIRHWLSNLNCKLPNSSHMQRIQKDLIQGRRDSRAQVSWQDFILRGFKQNLVLEKKIAKPSLPAEIPWDLTSPLQLPAQLGYLQAEKNEQGGLILNLDTTRLNIRFRQGGERCRPMGKKHSVSLKKLFQQWAIPEWRRSYIPLLFYDNELITVIGYCVCEPFAVINQMGWKINWITQQEIFLK